MKKGFAPMPGVDGWQVSNFPVLIGAPHLASLQLFERAGMRALRKKSLQLTGYLEKLLHAVDPDSRYFRVITPRDPASRGCQLSILMNHQQGLRVFKAITKRGVIADWREPNVIRIAPVPLYNSFEDVFRFASLFQQALLSTSPPRA